MKIVVLDGYTLNPGDISWEPIEVIGEFKVYDRTPPEKVIERASGAEIVLINKVRLTDELIGRLPGLKYIGVLATGYDTVDLGAAAKRGITVTFVPSYSTNSVAQLAWALLLELCHRVKEHDAAVKSGEWSRCPDVSFWNCPQVELYGKTMGIVGFGRIGSRVGEIAHAFGMKIAACDKLRGNKPDYGDFKWVELDELLCMSDVISLHCPLIPENQGMINQSSLMRMKHTAFLINTSRGGLVVDRHLADALNEGIIAGAAVDVLSVEPPPPDNPLFNAKNCIITPHIGWSTLESRNRLIYTAAGNIKAYLEGKPVNTAERRIIP
ncbi:MAG: D-2-hydroxyacid dehydrogenase [Ruminiclostridium sp.]|nr:D-2-hydroxyacid dehydrogenase [Ruminiclostridium sp.]